MTTTKERLHQLIEELSEEDLPAVERVLWGLRDTAIDPVLRMLDAVPIDEEHLAEEAREAHRAGVEQYRVGRSRPLRDTAP